MRRGAGRAERTVERILELEVVEMRRREARRRRRWRLMRGMRNRRNSWWVREGLASCGWERGRNER